MQLDHYVNTIGRHLRGRFGERVHKLPLHARFTCPNRDGTLGRGGCTFCNVRSFSDASEAPIAQQLAEGRTKMDRARRYLAYFQAYTSTYAEVETLQRLYAEALEAADIVGLCVGTRPDCVPDAVLDLLAGYREQGYEVWLELGLQSAFDETLARVNRGHGFAAYADAVSRAQARGVPVCTHLIVGLPGEPLERSFDTLDRVLELGVAGLKLHPLMIVKGSRMAAAWRRGEIAPAELGAYAEIAAEMIRRTPAAVVYHRVSATANAPTLLAPAWCASRFEGIQAVARRLAGTGTQGSLTDNPLGPHAAADKAHYLPHPAPPASEAPCAPTC
ncbi:MAG TPA: TIGR01212 family radical SAM protein [Aromatoleum sp.]|uniref:TIGR01212 family radical SAM protein n=1 Tax=Aromatoleum sp. TaxID=2307007 RepID=UPI002B46E051|nr:TIGR01212 family radical SAM protein [Aromatoleum sp.]HJV26041.1 TIGR01212 family radical SAM protein [Aromatoleum sp.]